MIKQTKTSKLKFNPLCVGCCTDAYDELSDTKIRELNIDVLFPCSACYDDYYGVHPDDFL